MVAENKRKPDKEDWMKEAEEAYERFLGDDSSWENPRTFDEIERHAVEVGDRLTSWLLEKGLGRPSAEPTSGTEAPCPRCGRACQPKDEGPEVREVETTRGEVPLTRRGYYCRPCRRVFFSSRPRTGSES